MCNYFLTDSILIVNSIVLKVIKEMNRNKEYPIKLPCVTSCHEKKQVG